MRVYALLLGLVLTTGYGYAAHVAVSSARTGRHAVVALAPPGRGALLDRIWYGGTLAPVVVESRRGALGALGTRSRLLDRSPGRCTPAGEPAARSFRAVS